MNFQNLQSISSQEFYVDLAFSRAKKRAEQIKGTKKNWKSQTDRIKALEKARIETVHSSISDQLLKIVKSFPDFDSLSEFYKEMTEIYYPLKKLQKSLSSLHWAVKRSQELSNVVLRKIKLESDKKQIEEYRKSYYGRIASILKQINPFLATLEEARKRLRGFPTVKDSLFTVSIVGFPNVGKSTLLSKLTFSMPEAKAYPFTTKGLNLGYARIKHDKIQFIDTPGSLNRPDKMNKIERLAHLTMKYLADVLVYVFDLTEEYPLASQKNLYKKIKKDFSKPILIYLSKTDLVNQSSINKFKADFKNIITSPEEIMEKLNELYLRER